MSEYNLPEDAHSPKRNWTLIDVLVPGKAGTLAVALGRWDSNPVIGMRWNGTKNNPVGNPQSRGLPTWFILDDPYAEAIIGTLTKEKQVLVRNFISEP